MAPPSFREIHESKTGKASDKWDSYLDYYDHLFTPLRDENIRLLEIGVQNGGSLETYAQYFKNGKIFIGCDINPDCSKLKYEDPRINVVVGDANADTAFTAIHKLEDQFDIIIDDGSHVSRDILNTFLIYFSSLKPGGIFVIEDTHTLYSPSYGGGLLSSISATEFFKKIIDIINYEWWGQHASMPAYMVSFFPDGRLPDCLADGWIESVEFRNSIITLRKSLHPSHNKLGDRIVRGKEFTVFNPETWPTSVPLHTPSN